jgi:hypothetical protein
MLSTIPFSPFAPDFSTQNWTDQKVPVLPMETTRVSGVMPAPDYDDKFQVYLLKDQILLASVHIQDNYSFSNGFFSFGTSAPHSDSRILVVDGNGNPLAAADTYQGEEPDPTTGQLTTDSYVSFRAPADGFYDMRVRTDRGEPTIAPLKSTGITYTADLRVVGLHKNDDSFNNSSTVVPLDPNHSSLDAALLSFNGGGLYAFLSSDKQTLTFSGPTGLGFTLQGDFTETDIHQPNSTMVAHEFSSKGSLELNTGMRPIFLPMPVGASFVVDTIPNGFGESYGEVQKTNFGPSLSLANIAATLGTDFDLNLSGATLSAPSLNWGIDLGGNSDVSSTGAPVNPAVPYLFINGNATIGGSYGGASLSVDRTGVGASVVFDPADPSLYVGLTGFPGPVTCLGMMASLDGLIPFTPTTALRNMTQTMYGDLYASGELDLGAIVGPECPVVIDGNVTLNLDPQHVGVGTAVTNIAKDIAGVFHQSTFSGTSAVSDQVANDLSQIQIGVNGTVSVGFDKGGFTLTVPVASGSLEWDGPRRAAELSITTSSVFQDSVLSFISPQSSYAVDAYFNGSTNAFDIDLVGSYTYMGATLSGDLDVSNTGIRIKGLADVLLNARTWTSDGTQDGIGLEADANVTVSLTMDLGGNNLDFTASVSASLGVYYYDLSGSIKESTYSKNFSYDSGYINVAQLGNSLEDLIKGKLGF